MSCFICDPKLQIQDNMNFQNTNRSQYKIPNIFGSIRNTSLRDMHDGFLHTIPYLSTADLCTAILLACCIFLHMFQIYMHKWLRRKLFKTKKRVELVFESLEVHLSHSYHLLFYKDNQYRESHDELPLDFKSLIMYYVI